MGGVCAPLASDGTARSEDTSKHLANAPTAERFAVFTATDDATRATSVIGGQLWIVTTSQHLVSAGVAETFDSTAGAGFVAHVTRSSKAGFIRVANAARSRFGSRKASVRTTTKSSANVWCFLVPYAVESLRTVRETDAAAAMTSGGTTPSVFTLHWIIKRDHPCR